MFFFSRALLLQGFMSPCYDVCVSTSGSRGLGARPPPAPKMFSKSCGFQAILSKFWAQPPSLVKTPLAPGQNPGSAPGVCPVVFVPPPRIPKTLSKFRFRKAKIFTQFPIPPIFFHLSFFGIFASSPCKQGATQCCQANEVLRGRVKPAAQVPAGSRLINIYRKFLLYILLSLCVL